MAKSTKKATKVAGVKKAAVRAQAKPAAASTKATKPKRVAKAVKGAPRATRRAIFIDVENTSSEASLFETLDALAIDRRAQPTDLTAVGNWRAVGQMVARRLAGLGAQLVHSAPARGVRDWSDLWIAVAAGCWLGQAMPGDVLEIVSNDRAFDAVGDAAAARGVVYRRLQHRHGASAPVSAPVSEVRAPQRARGGRRRGRGGRSQARPVAAAAPLRPISTPSSPSAAPSGMPHGASATQIAAVIDRLTNGQSGRWVNLDVLEKALKEDGFSRPPGSPRLVTRLRALKEMEVDNHGRVRLRQSAHNTAADAPTASAN